MASQNAVCESCRFYDEHKTNGGASAGNEGLCRFNPPVSQPEPKGHGLWPVVDAKDWCGHFSPDVMPAE